MIDTIVGVYNTRCHTSIKISPKEASLKKNEKEVYKNIYGDLDVGSKASKLKMSDQVRISKKKSLFETGYTLWWTEETFRIDEDKMMNPVTYELEDLNGEKIDGSFNEAELQKTTQKVFRIEKIVKRDKKNGSVLVKWRSYSSKFKSWIAMSNLEKTN